MIDGMTTCSKALDEQLSKIADQLSNHDSILCKLDFLCSIIQYHPNTFDMIQESLYSQQMVMENMIVMLAKLEKQPIQPSYCLYSHTKHYFIVFFLATTFPSISQSHQSILPLTTTFNISLFFLATISNTLTPRLPKYEIPLFTGENVQVGFSKLNMFLLTIAHLQIGSSRLPLYVYPIHHSNGTIACT